MSPRKEDKKKQEFFLSLSLSIILIFILRNCIFTQFAILLSLIEYHIHLTQQCQSFLTLFIYLSGVASYLDSYITLVFVIIKQNLLCLSVTNLTKELIENKVSPFFFFLTILHHN